LGLVNDTRYADSSSDICPCFPSYRILAITNNFMLFSIIRMSQETASRGKSHKSPSAKSGESIDFFDRLQLLTERYLSFRRRRIRLKKEKQKKKNVVLDWVEAFLWAAGVVLLINQYLLQAYQIPSGSMIDTLLIGDRIFVNKVIYGPELLPGIGKLPSPIQPSRNEIVIFMNPAYLSRGPVFDVAQRIIYMLTLSLVDIDRDEFGDPRPQFLIKRAVGVGGDRFVSERGNLRIRPAGEDRWFDEAEFNAMRGTSHNVIRLLSDQDYVALEAAGRVAAFSHLMLPVPHSLAAQVTAARAIPIPDSDAFNQARLEMLRGARPHERRYTSLLAWYRQGWYVPEGRIFPLGDNRDNSQDGRRFGSVSKSSVLGRALIVYWPGDFSSRRFAAFQRFGAIR